MKSIILIFCFTFLFLAGYGQGAAYNEKDYSRKPIWIAMIRDTAVNFFQAEKAFHAYFNQHELPGGENDEIGEHGKYEKFPSARERRKLEADNRMRMEVKKYRHWHDMMLPYVQPDGRILTPSERLAIYNQLKTKK